jgi:hypothetical protein
MARVRDDEPPSLVERAYVWMHRHFPHIVDCRPIDAAAVVESAGFTVEKRQELKIWTLPVAVVVARKGAGVRRRNS